MQLSDCPELKTRPRLQPFIQILLQDPREDAAPFETSVMPLASPDLESGRDLAP